MEYKMCKLSFLTKEVDTPGIAKSGWLLLFRRAHIDELLQIFRQELE